MLYERYSGTFASREGITWKVVIMQEAEMAFDEVGQLTFSAEEPLIIEWGETAKEEPIASSSATLTIISPGDRTYEDIYTIEVGQIRLDVYRNGILYWSGMLDPEFYEEPYCTDSNYEVTLTFSDFGILDRLKYDLTGVRSVQELLEYILLRSRVRYEYIVSCIDTLHVGNSSLLKNIGIRSDNFFDEDGEASTLREVLEGMLQPLALRVQQKNGRVWVYDLHTAFNSLPSVPIRWMSDDQVMSVDKVVNNVRVNLSTYSSASLLDGEIAYPGDYDVSLINFSTEDADYYTFYNDYSREGKDENRPSFTIFLDDNSDEKETGLAYVHPDSRYFHILPIFGGEESDGVMASMCAGSGSPSTGYFRRIGMSPKLKDESVLMRSKRVYIPFIPLYDERKKHFIRLTLEMLLDARYNPFTNAGDYNDAGDYNALKVWFGYVMVPVTVTLYDEAGEAIMHYSNEAEARETGMTAWLSGCMGRWKSGSATFGSCWLEWYNPDDRAENTGVLGWKKNRQTIGLTTGSITNDLRKIEDGQYIPYPSEAGWLEVCVYTGIYPWDFGETNFDSHGKADSKGLYDKIRWWLYKAPEIKIIRSYPPYDEVEADDVEYAGLLNTYAKEDLEIDTVCGTISPVCPTSKAQFLDLRNPYPGTLLTEITRAGRTSQPERLLIGTLYSQYARRMTKLTGTAAIDADGLTLFTESMQADKKFICLGDIQDLQADESEIIVVELRPDEYDETLLD